MRCSSIEAIVLRLVQKGAEQDSHTRGEDFDSRFVELLLHPSLNYNYSCSKQCQCQCLLSNVWVILNCRDLSWTIFQQLAFWYNWNSKKPNFHITRITAEWVQRRAIVGQENWNWRIFDKDSGFSITNISVDVCLFRILVFTAQVFIPQLNFEPSHESSIKTGSELICCPLSMASALLLWQLRSSFIPWSLENFRGEFVLKLFYVVIWQVHRWVLPFRSLFFWSHVHSNARLRCR